MHLTAIKRRKDVNLESYLMGFTPDVLFKRRPRLFERAERNYLFDNNGEQVFDRFSRLWCSGMAPGNLNHVFFTTGGSDAVDTALKIAVGYHRIKGDATRFRIIGRECGYHRVGLGGISVGDMVANRKMFTTMMLPGVDHLSHTHSHARHGLLQGPAHVGRAPRI